MEQQGDLTRMKKREKERCVSPLTSLWMGTYWDKSTAEPVELVLHRILNFPIYLQRQLEAAEQS